MSATQSVQIISDKEKIDFLALFFVLVLDEQAYIQEYE